MFAWNDLKPDRLPDSRRALVPDTVRLSPPVLLASRLVSIGWSVHHPDHECDLLAAAQRRDVEFERGLAPFVTPEALAVQKHFGLVVDSAKVKKNAITRTVWRRGDPPPVPDNGMEAVIVDPRRDGLRWEWDPDRTIESLATGKVPALIEPCVAVVKRELPLPT
jgi:hypothetical protein